MTNIIANELIIEGKDEDMQKFIDEYYIFNKFYGKKKWEIPCRNVEGFNLYEESCCLMFNTSWYPPTKWLKEIREKYSSLKFSIIWRYIDNSDHCGIIDSNGQEFSIVNSDDFKLAYKLVNKYHQKNLVDTPSIPKINVRQINKNLYCSIDHNLALSFVNNSNMIFCHGIFDQQTEEILPLTSEGESICQELDIPIGKYKSSI